MKFLYLNHWSLEEKLLLLMKLLLLVQSFLKEFKLSYFKEYKYEVIQSKKYLFHTYKYIYQNPIRANLVKRAENYPYSSMYYLSRKKSFSVPLVDKYGINDEFKMTWLNQSDFP